MTRVIGIAWASLSCAGFVALGGCGNTDAAKSSPESAPSATTAAEPLNISGSTAAANNSASRLDQLHPEVVIDTSYGPVTVKLDAENAPITVGNFLSYVQRGHYNSTVFHEVQKGFIAIGGGYTSDLREKPAEFPIRNEAHNGLKNQRYTIAMARVADSVDSATCHFFFNLADNASLNHQGDDAAKYGYCVFGEVIAGREVLDKLDATSVTKQGDFASFPATPVAIQNVRRIR